MSTLPDDARRLEPQQGSVQLRDYLRARRHGHDRFSSAEYAGLPVQEAELIDREEGLA